MALTVGSVLSNCPMLVIKEAMHLLELKNEQSDRLSLLMISSVAEEVSHRSSFSTTKPMTH